MNRPLIIIKPPSDNAGENYLKMIFLTVWKRGWVQLFQIWWKNITHSFFAEDYSYIGTQLKYKTFSRFQLQTSASQSTLEIEFYGLHYRNDGILTWNFLLESLDLYFQLSLNRCKASQIVNKIRFFIWLRPSRFSRKQNKPSIRVVVF